MEENKVSYLRLINTPLQQGGEVFPPKFAETLRNLMGLLALPGLWIGRNAQAIMRITFEAIERAIPIRFLYSEAQLEPDAISALLMWDRNFESEDLLNTWENEISSIKFIEMHEGKPYELEIRNETLRMVRLSLGYGPTAGTIWLGSAKQDFPTLTDLAFIRAAITLAGTGILTAKAQQEAEKANRAKDEFMAILGHELRNPLAPIMMSVDVLKLKNKGELPKELQIIDRQSKHLAQLVDDLLDVSRITSGKIVLKDDLVNLNDVLARAIENCAPLLNEKRHHLSQQLLNDPQPIIRGDSYRLIQIFTNLLNNAAKFMSEGGHIHVSSALNGAMIQICVQDQGPGISADLIPNIFNMFEQGGQTIERSKGGLGIGLSVVKSLVELHAGRVQVESTEGQGARFSVLLPLVFESNIESSATVQTIAAAPAKKILLVDDNLDGLQMLAEYLEIIGYTLATAAHPQQALGVIESFAPDIVILDIGLPEMSGYELAGLIHSKSKQKPFMIALTGYGQQKDIAMSRQAGFDYHLTKPIALDTLEDVLSKFNVD